MKDLYVLVFINNEMVSCSFKMGKVQIEGQNNCIDYNEQKKAKWDKKYRSIDMSVGEESCLLGVNK